MSELVSIKGRSYGLPMRQNEKFEFVIRLCHDVLVEALLFGDRRQLIKLERVGRRFHRIIEDFFRRIPFLCLSLGIDRNEDAYGVIIIGHHEWHEKIPLQELTTFPPFLRFNYVKLWFDCGSHSEPVEKLREFIESHLLPLKLALKDSNMILSCGYKFHISFDYFYWNSASMITSLLQMVEFQDCSNVEIEMGVVFKRIDIGEMLLPVAAILKWLEKPADRTGNIAAQVQKEKFLRIGLFSRIQIQNAQQMLGHLKTKFVKAELPVRPFTFRYGYFDVCEFGTETLINNKTAEEMSVSVLKHGAIEIRRARKDKKKN